MNPMDYARAITEFWTVQSQAMLQAQDQAGRQATEMLTQGMQALASGALPGLSTDLSAGADELAQASQSMAEMWTAATALSSALTRSVPDAGVDPTVRATMQTMLDPRAWLGGGLTGAGEMGEVLGRMAEGPRLADLFDVERRYARVLAGWMGVRRSQMEHNAVVLEAWLRAGRSFGEELAGHVGLEGERPDGRAALALWTEIANKELLSTQRSEPFLRTQTAMIRASTELRMAQQELVEHFGKQYGFPTRTELDDVHRTVTELRRELRAMRRASAGQPAAAAPVRARKRAR